MDDSIMQLKRARMTAIVLATSTIFAVLSFVFGYIQKQKVNQLIIEVDTCKRLAAEMKQLAIANELRAVQCENRMGK